MSIMASAAGVPHTERVPRRSISPLAPSGAQWPWHHPVCPCPRFPRAWGACVCSCLCLSVEVFKPASCYKSKYEPKMCFITSWTPEKTCPRLRYFNSQARQILWTCFPAHFTHPMQMCSFVTLSCCQPKMYFLWQVIYEPFCWILHCQPFPPTECIDHSYGRKSMLIWRARQVPSAKYQTVNVWDETTMMRTNKGQRLNLEQTTIQQLINVRADICSAHIRPSKP